MTGLPLLAGWFWRLACDGAPFEGMSVCSTMSRRSPNSLGLRASNERWTKDATFEQRLSLEDKRLFKDPGIAV